MKKNTNTINSTKGEAKKAKGKKSVAEAKPAVAKIKAAPKRKRVSALDAAATVLQKKGEPMRAQEMIAAMADAGLWTSPGGKTPHATLYAAIIREISVKGKDARFAKHDRGLFAFNS